MLTNEPYSKVLPIIRINTVWELIVAALCVFYSDLIHRFSRTWSCS